MSNASLSPPPLTEALLAWLPAPSRWGPWLTRLPRPGGHWIGERLLGQALSAALSDGSLEPIADRCLAIEVDDLNWRWVLRVQGGRIEVLRDDHPAEASVRGSLTDLLLLASRIEDADTLFFQRRLQLTGDVELGLCARNLLDRLRWEQIPLALRIPLNRAARLARDAREAHRRRLNQRADVNQSNRDATGDSRAKISASSSLPGSTLESAPDSPLDSSASAAP